MGKGKNSSTRVMDTAGGLDLLHTLAGHDDVILRVTWSPDGRFLASTSVDKSVCLWDTKTGKHIQTLYGHSQGVNDAAWSSNGRLLATPSFDRTIRIWSWEDREDRWEYLRTLQRHSGDVRSAAWSPDMSTLASGSIDRTILLWDTKTWQPRSELAEHRDAVLNLIWARNGEKIYSSSEDKTIRIWDLKSQSCQVLRGHAAGVVYLAESGDGRLLASSAFDGTIRIWDPFEGRQICILEGHRGVVRSVSFSPGDRLLASNSKDGTVRLWRCDTWEMVRSVKEQPSFYWPPCVAFSPKAPVLATLGRRDMVVRLWNVDVSTQLGVTPVPASRYRNAKVVLVGDTGVGKTGLGLVLAGQKWEPTESTHGRRVWPLGTQEIPVEGGRQELRETLLWDLAGQPGYRIIHQLHLTGVAVALVVFDARSETLPFAGIAYWARVLDDAARGFPLVKFLVCARADRGSKTVSEARIEEVCKAYGFAEFFKTSAKEGDGVEELERAIRSAIRWGHLPSISSPDLFRRMKNFIVEEKQAGRTLQTRGDFLERYRTTSGETDASQDAFETCLGLMESAQLIRQLSFQSLVLLQPEYMDAYCAWLAFAAREEPDGLGSIPEQQARSGDFHMDQDRPLKGLLEETLLLPAMIEEVIGRGIAVRQPTEKGDMLVFPSELRSDMPNYPGGYVRSVTFEFDGPVSAIYATMAVCLTHSSAFTKEKFYRNVALFGSPTGEICGFAMDYPEPMNDVRGRLTVFFEGGTGRATKLIFLRYVNRQLEDMAFEGSIRRRRAYYCECGYRIPDDAIELRTKLGKKTAICAVCARQWDLDDLAERSAEKSETVEKIWESAQEERERQKRLTVLPEREQVSQYHVFLCHNSKDKPQVRELAGRLREQGLLPWIDEDGILAGERFSPVLEAVIDAIPAALIIVGPHWLGNWQKEEYYALFHRYVEQREQKAEHSQGLRLIPVLLPGGPDPRELPRFLRVVNVVDFRTSGLDDREEMSRLVEAILREGREFAR